MKPAKNQVDLKRRKPSNKFLLQRMQTIQEQTGGKTDVPHRHDYYTVILVESAEGKHVVDYQTYYFGSKQVFFVSPGQIHQVLTYGIPQGWVFTFSRDFMAENNIPEQFISNLNLFRQFGETPPIELDSENFDRLKDIILMMESCVPRDLKYKTRALGAYLQLFLIYCNNTCSLELKELDEENSGICMLRDFKNLVDQHYMKWHKVGKYASEIHISPKHLSQTVKDMTGKTAKEYIQDRIILEAKRYLWHTNLSVKEIALNLGFEEPLHFSGFFKKRSKISPTSFRDLKQ